MPIVTNVVLSHHSRRPVEIKVVWHATANWSQICFAQSAIAIPSLREDGVYVSRPFVSDTPLVLHKSFDKLLQPRTR